MRIGLVAEPYEEASASGMGYSVRETMRQLPLAAPEHTFVFYSSRPISRELIDVPFENRIMPKGFIRQFVWFFFLRDKLDALLFVAPLLPLVIPRRIKAVILCKELANRHVRPRGLRAKLVTFLHDSLLMPWSLARAAKVIAPSEATTRDVEKYYGVPADKIEIIYEGFQDLREVPNEPVTPAPEGPYFIFVSKMKERKNVHGIIEALALLHKHMEHAPALELVGGQGGSYAERVQALIRERKLTDHVRFRGYVSPGELKTLYQGATACVYPSLSEGFGMPIIEAMSLGAPVITSDRSSMREVAADAALLVDPENPASIAMAMETLATDAHRRDELIRKGEERVRLFSWPETGRRIAASLNRL